MTLKKYTLDGHRYVLYSKSLYRVLHEAEQPDEETLYYCRVSDMAKTDGVVAEEFVARFEEGSPLADESRFVLPPDEDHTYGILDITALDTLLEVTLVEETDQFAPPDGDWSWQSRVNQMCRDPSDLMTPPLLVSTTGEEGRAQLDDWTNNRAAEIIDDLPRDGAVLICPESDVRFLCEADFVEAVEVEGVGSELA